MKAIVKRIDPRSVTNIHRVIGNKMREMRVARKISQQELGEHLGLSFQQIQKYEKGANRIDAARLIEIAEVFGVNIDEFYDGLTKKRAKSGPTPRDHYLASREALQLVDAMVAIESPEIRRKIIALAATVGGQNADE